MKKLLIFLAVVLVVLLSAFLALLANVNRAKPLLEQRLSTALGHPVKLGILKLGWNGGPVFGSESFSVWPGTTESGAPALQLKNIKIFVKNPSWSQPMDFEGSAGFLSRHPNLKFKGRVVLKSDAGPGVLERLHTELDLGQLDLRQVRTAASDTLKDLDLARPLRGRMTADVGQVALDAEGLSHAQAVLSLEGGQVALEKLKNPIHDIALAASLTTREVHLDSLTAFLAGGKLTAQAMAENLGASPSARLEFSAEDLSLEEFALGANPDKPQLKARLFGLFRGTSGGTSWAQLSQNLSGSGRLILKDPVVTRINFLREILSQLSRLPKMAETLQNNLPPYYQSKLAEPFTALQPMNLPFEVKGGAFYFNDLKVGTTEFLLTGQGRVTFNGNLSIQSWLIINTDLSAVLASGVEEIRYFMDTLGQIQIPVRIEGSMNHIQFKPDTDYIAKKVAMNKGQELLSELLSKNKKAGSAAKGLLGKLI